ncbi:MAG TPA: ATP-binding protein [Firmicutes bacterium]|nr:ATP-binding protein [Bacillota bacterium]
MADGAALSFMNEVDLYTLFGNAFDNAIEAVKKTEPSRRVISLSVTRAGQMLSVSMRNYYSGDVHMNGGLPETTKADREFHGYGLQSIKRITEKYGGNVQITARDGIFNLGLLFFMPKSTDSVG